MGQKEIFRTVNYSLVICRNPFKQSIHYNKWLAIKETNNKGWWCAGGSAKYQETFAATALRECKEESGIDVELKGILKID